MIKSAFRLWPGILAGVGLGLGYLFLGTAAALVSGWLFACCIVLCFNIQLRLFYIAGVCFYSSTLWWLPEIVRIYGEFSSSAALALSIVLFLVAAFQFLFFGWLASRLQQTKLERAGLDLPFAWLGGELFIPQLLPWSLGHSQLPSRTLAQLADLAGIELVGALLLWCVTLAIRSLQTSRDRSLRLKLLVLLCVFVPSYSLIRKQQVAADLQNAPSLKITSIQANLDPRRDFRSELSSQTLQKYLSLTAAATRSSVPDLAIWPESSVWFDIPYQNRSQSVPIGELSQLPMPLIFGGQTRYNTSGGKPAYSNSAYVVTDGQVSRPYRKQELFPFSEMIPLSGLLPFLNQFSSKDYSMRAGESEVPLEFVSRSGQTISAPIAICYEDLIPNVYRKQIRESSASGSPSLLIGLTNDAWFLKTPAARQHAELSRARALEFRRYFVRSTNTGVTTVYDPFGDVIAELPQFEAALLSANVRPLQIQTGAALGGSELLSILTCICILVAVRQRCKKR